MKSARGDKKATRSVVIGTAGHIDHGKTSLVYALTGTATDRLPEEKSRGITIDLGFAHLRLMDENGEAIDLSLIDVPGHHGFIRNMLAGTGGIDCVVLVIAADEGIKAQTQEHLQICSLLGISHGIIALTKKDAVSTERLREARGEVKQFVRHTFLEDAPIVSVSAVTRDGITELKAELARLALRVPRRSADRIARLPLDRAFSVKGFGTVVTGTLQAGAVREGDTLELKPENRAVRVRGIQLHGEAVSAVDAPNRVALNVADIEVNDARRGDVLVPPGTLQPTTTVDVDISMLPGAPALKHRSRVRVHAFTSETVATVLLYPSGSWDGEEKTLARLRLVKPLLLLPEDRFVIRQLSPALTIGGGRVLDADPLHKLRKSAAQQWLQEIRSANAREQVGFRVQRRGVDGISFVSLSAETGLTPATLREVVQPLLADGSICENANYLIAGASLQRAATLLLTEAGRAKGGALSRAELRTRTKLEEPVFGLAVRLLIQQERLSANQGVLSVCASGPVDQDPRIAGIRQMYADAGLAPPLVSEVSDKLGIPLKQLQPMLTSLLRAKALVRMGSDNLLADAQALRKLVEQLRRHRGEVFDVARFKSLTGLTRKHAIPLLEYLDGSRVTRSDNGRRTVL